ncbi:hypothetical protein [Methylocystis iwaonis]|uniref:hypothetical protein n=1 Tax=Methylocystis iwaonis TaxID=2885079 RepID=UPI002E7BBA2A|nr:hypothetical protein [Methylocystis iwaonis]
MTLSFSSFLASLGAAEPPALPAPLRALWLDASGDWDGAHQCVTDAEDADGMRVHAYLHRKEGDLSNARYWYARAGVPPQDCPLEEEWRAIASALLAQR